MGDRSNLLNYQGCKIDIERLRELNKSYKNEWCEEFLERFDSVKGEEKEEFCLPDWLDGHKIHGYWYTDFVEFLYMCVDVMDDLNDAMGENSINMITESNSEFYIHFLLDEAENRIVKVEYKPMVDFEEMIMKRKCCSCGIVLSDDDEFVIDKSKGTIHKDKNKCLVNRLRRKIGFNGDYYIENDGD